MQILSASQIRQWDLYTIETDHISSVDLMERAAARCVDWIDEHYYARRSFTIFCGKGNNGGDGLAIARMLTARQYNVKVFILEFGHKGTDDFQVNLARLHESSVEISFIQSAENIRPIPSDDIVIDALFGSGLNRPLEAVTAELVEHINGSGNLVISIDIPSGMFCDDSSSGHAVVKANHTLSFQCYKLAFIVPENAEATGQIHILDIGLNKAFLSTIQPAFEFIGPDLVKSIYRPRKQYSHKGTFGHAGLITGSYGMMGAAVLCASACIKAGVGKLTCHIPGMGYSILQSTVPEAMCKVEMNEKFIEDISTLEHYSSLGVGPGLGNYDGHAQLLEKIFSSYQKPIVLDADALNTLANHADLLNKIPARSVLTPHIKEFERVFGPCDNDFKRIKLATEMAGIFQLIIVLKGHYSFIAMPGGKGYFNTTGNPGMATGGTGDVLTGILTGILAQGYPAEAAALLSVYLHGLSGDIALHDESEESLSAKDLITHLGKAWKKMQE